MKGLLFTLKASFQVPARICKFSLPWLCLHESTRGARPAGAGADAGGIG